MRFKTIIDLKTGRVQDNVPFTPEEEADFDRMVAEEEAKQPVGALTLAAELAALTAKLARYEKAEAALIQKGVLVADDVKADATVKAR